MGGFLGIGGSAAKTDRKEQLTAYSDLHNVFSFALPAGESSFKAGQSQLGDAASYWKGILSGNRTAVNAATAPAANAARTSADAAKRQIATSGTARGGGTAGTNQQVNDKTRATIDDEIFGARGDAAKATAAIGGTELSVATNLLGLGEKSAGDLGQLAGDSRKESDKNNSALGSAAGQLAMAALMFA
jgi:hypothetical protein